jgi:hypothetical protein
VINFGIPYIGQKAFFEGYLSLQRLLIFIFIDFIMVNTRDVVPNGFSLAGYLRPSILINSLVVNYGLRGHIEGHGG